MTSTFDYRPPWGTILLVILGFGGAAGILGSVAATNDHGLILSGLIKLSINQATIFYWVLFSFAVGFVLAGCALVVMRLSIHQQVVVSDSTVTLPRSRWTTTTQTIAFADIHNIELVEVAGQRFAHLAHQGGKATITASMLPKKSDFDAIVQTITNHSA